MRTTAMTENEAVKESIVKSLIKIMENKDFEDITITEIVKDAGVSRMSYYRNFSSKEDILAYYTEYVLSNFVSESSQEKDANIHEFSKSFFEHLRNHKQLLSGLAKANLSNIFIEKFGKHFEQLFIDVDKLSEAEKLKEYALKYRIGGTAAVILDWAEKGLKESDEEMAEVFRYLYEL